VKNKSFPLPRIKHIVGKHLILLLLILTATIPGCTSGKDVAVFPVKLLGFFIQLLGIPFIIYLVIRIVMVNLSRRFMRKKSNQAVEDSENEDKEFVKPSTAVSFREFSETEEIFLTTKQGENLELAINTGLRTWSIFKKSVGFVLLGTVVLCFASKLLFGEFKLASPVWIVITTLIMYFMARLRFRATRRVSLMMCFVGYSLLLLFYGLYFIALYAPKDANTIAWFFFVLVLLAVSFIIYEFLKIKKILVPAGNRQLLILRVFGSDHNTAFLFREISRTWRFLGSFVTIADPSYIRYQHSLSSRENRRMFFNLFILYFIILAIVTYGIEHQLSIYFPSWLLLLWIKLPALQVMFIMGVLITLIVLPVVLVCFSVITHRRFIPSIKRLNKTIDKIITNKRSVSATYKNFTLFCFDNIWKNAVKRSLLVSKAVLMDLRGFVPERRGCQYEIGLLINNYPINKILFLADEGPAIETIKEIVRQEWDAMNPSSPNRSIQNPELKFYYVREEDKKDINRIIALLTLDLEHSETTSQAEKGVAKEISLKDRIQKAAAWYAAGLTPAGDGLIIKKEKYFSKTKNRIGFLEKWDLKLARPSSGKIFIPVLFILLLGILTYYSIPFINSFSKYKNPFTIVATPGQQHHSNRPIPDSPVITILIKEKDINGQYGTIGGRSYDSVLLWSLGITGGKPGTAYKYSNASIRAETKDGLELVTDPENITAGGYTPSYEAYGGLVLRDKSVDDTTKEEGMLIVDNKTYLPRKNHTIAVIKGTIDLSFIQPDQKYIVTSLDSLLSKSDLIEITIPDEKPARRIWLERIPGNKNRFALILPDYIEDYEVHVFNDKGEIIYIPVVNNNNVWQIDQAELKNARIEIIPKKFFRNESWSFEKPFLPLPTKKD
jgi:hypothetical protein